MLQSPSVRPHSTTHPSGGWFSTPRSGSTKQVTQSSPVVTVVTRVVSKHPKPPRAASSSPASTSRAAPHSAPPTVSKKRRSDEEEWLPSRAVKKSRVTPTKPTKKRTPQRQAISRSVTPPEDVYRISRSHSVSSFDLPEAPQTPRKCWTDSDGSVGDGFVSSERVVKGLMHSYKAFFKNPNDPNDTSFEPHPTDYPFVELEYPNDAACERFMLLEPKDKDHYNPIMCLEDTLHTIVEYYLTPAQQSLLGSLPDHSLSSPKNRPPNSSHSATSSISSLSALSDLSDLSDLTSLSSESSLSSLSSLSALSEESSPPQNLLRSLSRAIHLRDGPQFLSTMRHINNILRMIKYPYVPELSPCSPTINPLREIPKLWSTTGIPQKVMTRIIEETYQRSIGPNIAKLRQYSAFSSEVYGELMPAFTSDIVNATGLRPDALFVDLGCGVGNVVLQASLQTGCRSFGIEIMPGPSSLAKGQLEQFKKRCRMWGVEAGEVELMQGDMTDCRRVDELLSQADVVLVNNFVFREELNAALRPKFLDLKEGAIVVSLKPFAPPTNQRLTERNIDDISAIFDVVRRPYHSGTVSWSSGSGHYYIHRVDRASYSDCRQQFERVHSRLGRRRSAKR